MKRFANLLKKLPLYDAEREATRGNNRHSGDIKAEISHNQEEIEREEGRSKDHKKDREWSNETDHSHWTY